MITPSTTLAEIASTAPALTRQLERLGLDYCCAGKRSLAEACREQQLDPCQATSAFGPLATRKLVHLMAC